MNKVVAIIWQDHFSIHQESWPLKIDQMAIPTLSVGVVVEETEEYIVLASTIERIGGTDIDAMVIYKDSIISEKQYGEIEVELNY